MKTALLAVVILFGLATVAEAQCVGRVCPFNPLRAPIADKARVAIKALPRPIWTITRPGFVLAAKVAKAAVHVAKATIRPVVLSHNWRTTAHERRCAMCLGQHLRNYHGKTYDALDAVGYANWVRHHEGLHDGGVYQGATCTGPDCSGGRTGILRRFRR